MPAFNVPLIIRGEVIDEHRVTFGGRGASVQFSSPDARHYLDRLPLSTPSALADLYEISFEEILDYLEELGHRLSFQTNPYLRDALELSIGTSGLGAAILRSLYESMHTVFDRKQIRDMADLTLGIPFLEGWVNTRTADGTKTFVRALGARSIHITAGNVPTLAALTVMRNAVTRSDMIIKSPSNDPLTACAIARTMIDMAPSHPITRHISVGYWKGGDQSVEEELYKSSNVDKIVAWGGGPSVTHIMKYLQPGIELITLEPKLSSTIIGREAFKSEGCMRDVARRAALDIAVYNQQACVNARVIYVQSGTDAAGLECANRFGRLLYDAILAVPAHLSNPVRALNPELAQEMEGLRYAGDLYKVFGGDGRGAVIVSQTGEPVDFAALLSNRVANLVPVDDLETPIRSVTAFTQSIGIYPDSLIPQIRDRLSFHGAQRLVSLGYVATTRTIAGPHDGTEPIRRMCKWILSETHDSSGDPVWPCGTG
jgi:hypothetical protein